MVKDPAKPGLLGSGLLSLEQRVAPDHVGDLRENRGHLRVTNEHHDRTLGVPPTQVSHELVDGLGKTLWSLPKLALGDEDVLAIDPDQDVRLTVSVERLSGRGPLVVSV